MNEMKELETRLHSWPLRRPSRRLEQRLFDRHRADLPSSFSFGWLVPATAAMLLLCIVMNPRNNSNFSGISSAGPMVAMIMSNQSAAAYLPGSFDHDQNTIPADTFKWTNASGSTSSIRSLSGPKGN